MSFGFAAVGTREEVLAQLQAIHPSITDPGATLGPEIADLLARHLQAELSPSDPAWQVRYVIKASGHSGTGSHLNLNITAESHYTQVPAEASA